MFVSAVNILIDQNESGHIKLAFAEAPSLAVFRSNFIKN